MRFSSSAISFIMSSPASRRTAATERATAPGKSAARIRRARRPRTAARRPRRTAPVPMNGAPLHPMHPDEELDDRDVKKVHENQQENESRPAEDERRDEGNEADQGR